MIFYVPYINLPTQPGREIFSWLFLYIWCLYSLFLYFTLGLIFRFLGLGNKFANRKGR